MGKQGEVPVERIEAEVMLPRMLRDEQIRKAHLVDAVPLTNCLFKRSSGRSSVVLMAASFICTSHAIYADRLPYLRVLVHAFFCRRMPLAFSIKSYYSVIHIHGIWRRKNNAKG